MTEADYKRTETFLIVKYGSMQKAIDAWLNKDFESDGFDMMEVFLAQPPTFDKERNETN